MAERWVRDHIMPFYDILEATRLLEAAMIRNGWLVKLVRSNITRGWTYNSEMFRIVKTNRVHENGDPVFQYVPWTAGSGLDPLSALIDAAHLCNVRTPDLLVAILEAELCRLGLAVAVARQRERTLAVLDDTLADLTAALALVNAEPMVNEIDEDDDL